VSSPFPSLSTDTGAGYMSLSTRPFLCPVTRKEPESAVGVPARVRHAAVEHVVDCANGHDRQAEFPRTVNDPRSDEWNAVDRIHIRREQEWVELRIMRMPRTGNPVPTT